jgi:hypothetical protein
MLIIRTSLSLSFQVSARTGFVNAILTISGRKNRACFDFQIKKPRPRSFALSAAMHGGLRPASRTASHFGGPSCPAFPFHSKKLWRLYGRSQSAKERIVIASQTG